MNGKTWTPKDVHELWQAQQEYNQKSYETAKQIMQPKRNTGKYQDFDSLKKAAENAINSATTVETIDVQPIYELAKACAAAVLKKCLDPQRKAGNSYAVSNTGCDPILTDALKDLRRYSDCGTAQDMVQEIVTTILAVYDSGAGINPATGKFDLDYTYKTSKTVKKVYKTATATATYKDVDTTPIQSAWQAGRRLVEERGSVKTDPTCKYTYIDIDDPATADPIYYRSRRYSDVETIQDVLDIDRLIDLLHLTAPQRAAVEYRLQGKSLAEVAKTMGKTKQAVAKNLAGAGAKAIKAGIVQTSTIGGKTVYYIDNNGLQAALDKIFPDVPQA